MGDDDAKKLHALYGSAGMAAAGMIRVTKPKPKPEEKPKEEAPPAEEEESPEGSAPPEEANETSADALAPGTDEEEAKPGNRAKKKTAKKKASTKKKTTKKKAAKKKASTRKKTAKKKATAKKKTAKKKDEEKEPDAEAAPEAGEREDAAPAAPEYTGLKAAVAGHTGRGDFGPQLDRVFQRLDGVRLDGIVDADEETAEASRIRTGALRGYADFATMLREEQPDLVCLANASSAEHFAMAKSSLEYGAHLLCEPPFTTTLKEADDLLSFARDGKFLVSVVLPMRLDPLVRRFHEERDSLIGDLLEMHVLGTMDDRAGGEDLLMHGSHLFDLVRWFAGDPSYCTASITREGIPAIAEDSHESQGLDLGLLLGDSIHATFTMESGVRVTFVSDSRYREVAGPWGIEFVGTKGRMRLFAGFPPTLSLMQHSPPEDADRTETWQRWPEMDGDTPYHAPFERYEGHEAANRRVVHDLLEAIEQKKDPECSGERAARALEMIHGIWQAGVTMRRAYFPLVNRLHPLREDDL